MIKIFLSIILLLLLPSVANACAFSPSPLTSPTGVLSPSVSPPVALNIEDFVTDLRVPWEMVFAGDGRIFITERPGTIRIINNGILVSEPWITLDVSATGEGGLLGMALDPEFSKNGYVYVAYTFRDSAGNLRNRLERIKEEPGEGKGKPDKILIDNIPGASIHDGGRVKLGQDGKLYYTTGDAGNAKLSQDINSLAGKILRINKDGSIPEDNPFPGSSVYSYGHRNPEGLAFQPGTGRLYATEHGSSARDEVNYIEAGKNYGWPEITGDQTAVNMVNPLIHSGSDTWAPAGATFITGGPWDGSLLFTGLRGQSLFRVVLDSTNPLQVISFERHLHNQYGRLRNVIQGPDGAIYILTNNTDGRGNPGPEDDRILKLTIKLE